MPEIILTPEQQAEAVEIFNECTDVNTEIGSDYQTLVDTQILLKQKQQELKALMALIPRDLTIEEPLFIEMQGLQTDIADLNVILAPKLAILADLQQRSNNLFNSIRDNYQDVTDAEIREALDTIHPTITTSPVPTIIDFGNVDIGTFSVLQYNVGGYNLTDPININVIGSTEYTISLNDITYSDHLIIDPGPDGVLEDTLIYVKYEPIDDGEDLASLRHTTVGASPIDVSVSGIGTNPASINVVPNVIGFGNTVIGVGGGSGYTLTGSGLVDDVIITSDNVKVEVSSDGISFFPSISITPEPDGSVFESISMQYQPTMETGDVGVITNESTGATTQNVDWSGVGVQPLIFEEPFGANGGPPPGMNFPAGWIEPVGGDPGAGDWIIIEGDVEIPACDVFDTSAGAFMKFKNIAGVTESTITRAVDTTGYTNIKVRWNEYRAIGAPAIIFEYSINGIDWAAVAFTEVGDTGIWEASSEITLPPDAENTSTVYFKFTIIGDGLGHATAIDDLRVSGLPI